MSPDLTAMIRRITQLRERLASTSVTRELRAEVDDVLTEGYSRALTGDAWSTRTEQRLHELITGTGTPVGSELRVIATDHAAFQRDLIELRRELTELWHARDALGAGARVVSA